MMVRYSFSGARCSLDSVLRVHIKSRSIPTPAFESSGGNQLNYSRQLVAGALVLVAFSLVGCSGAASHSVRPDVSALTCSQFLKSTSSKQQSDVGSLKLPSMASYNNLGATAVDPVQYVTHACKNTYGSEPLTGIALAAAQIVPSCDQYKAQSSTVQSSWASEYLKTRGIESSIPVADQSKALLVGCDSKTNASADLSESVSNMEKFLQSHPGEIAEYLTSNGNPGSTIVQGAQRTIAWDAKDSNGYTTHSVATWGSLQRTSGSTSDPAAPSFVLGTACGFDPATDAFSVGTWTVTNTTSQFAATLSSQFNIQGLSETAPVTVDIEAQFSSGAECFKSVTNVPTATVTTQQKVGAGLSVSIPFFFIVHNYYSPRYPSGDVAAIDATTVNAGIFGSPIRAPLN